jgi:hypothetical protein
MAVKEDCNEWDKSPLFYTYWAHIETYHLFEPKAYRHISLDILGKGRKFGPI